MKKSMSLCLVAVLVLLTLAGCGKKLNVDKNTVYLKKKAMYIGAIVKKFDKYYYVAYDLQSFVNDRVEAYVSTHEKDSVKVDEFSVEEGVAKLNVSYAGYEDYAALNEVELFAGTVPQALAAGYDFDAAFLKVEEGKLGGEASKEEIIGASDYKVVILSEKLDVKVDGTIAYVSSQYTSLASKDTVSITLPEDAIDGEEMTLTYIVYKQ